MISNTEQHSFQFACPPPHGAILVLPLGATQFDLVSRVPMEAYIKRNVSQWYNRMDEREDLIIVTGVDKCSSWGTACYSDVTGTAEMALSFIPTSRRHEGSPAWPYAWRTSDSIWSRSGRNSEEHFSENQSIFIRGFKTKLRKRKLLPGRVSISDVVRSDTDISGGGAKGQGGSTLPSWLPGPFGNNRGEASHNLQSDTPSDMIEVDDFPALNEVNLVSNEIFCGSGLVSLFIHWIPSIHTYWTWFDHQYFCSDISSTHSRTLMLRLLSHTTTYGAALYKRSCNITQLSSPNLDIVSWCFVG
jgi:hypothetical protein